MKISSFTHTGMVRKNNEDACLVIPPWSSLALNKGACLFAVADGMGGQNAGEVASGLAILAIKEWFKEADFKNLSVEMVEELFAYANLKIWNHSQKNPEASGMGTTLTLMLLAGKKALVGHIGDTRLYRFRNDLMMQLTNDHSLVAEQVKTGKLTKEQAMLHPTRHILSRVLGVRQFVQPEIFFSDLQANDSFLLCSDGICGMIDDQKISKKFEEVEIAQLAPEVVAEANAAGGKDNCTAVAFKLEELPVMLPGRFSLDRFRNIISNWGNAGTV